MNFKLFMILFVSLVLFGCVQKPLIFFGESDNWKVQYEVTKDDGCNATTGYIKYIGNEPIPEQLEVTIDNAGGTTISLDENKTFIFPNGCSNASEGSEIKAEVTWENQSDTLLLKLK